MKVGVKINHLVEKIGLQCQLSSIGLPYAARMSYPYYKDINLQFYAVARGKSKTFIPGFYPTFWEISLLCTGKNYKKKDY